MAKKRPVLARLLEVLEPGDVLVVTKLDRLARNTFDLLRVIERIGNAGTSFKSLGEPCAETTTPHGRLMLTVLGGVADYTDTAVMQRWAAGMQAWPGFQRRGAQFNLPPTMDHIHFLFTQTNYPIFLWNSFFIGVIVVAITLVLAVPAAYSLAG